MIETISTSSRLTSLRLLTALYGQTLGHDTYAQLSAIIQCYRPQLGLQTSRAGLDLTGRDAILITYGDQVRADNQPPLRALADFCNQHLPALITGIHLLPFFPYSSDDGFSVIDFRQVDPGLGDWEAIARLQARFRLMVDAVINHVSARSAWFQAYLRGDPAYQHYFITVEGQPDLSQVVRPRTLPLLTSFATADGEKHVWTTFSADQIDLNYANPEILLEIIDLLLFYITHGAEYIRLDAIAYLWKELGTPCIHQPQTHQIIQLFRAVLDEVAPQVKLITETNVPHADNVAYFGDGQNEAHLVYNFALPPLMLHGFRTQQANELTRWVNGLVLPSERVAFFNFLASHDGIGLNPARGLLPEDALDALVQQTIAHGGLVSYKHNPDGSQSAYELNINYFDALSAPDGQEPIDLQVDRFIAAQAIMLALAGLPGIYFHSLFGSRGWLEGAAQTGHNRAINRQKLNQVDLERELTDETSLRHKVFSRYARLLTVRAGSPAFRPHSTQRALDCADALFVLLRVDPVQGARVLCLHNVSGQPQSVRLNLEDLLGPTVAGGWVTDLITGQRFRSQRKAPLRLRPYQVYWLAGVPMPRKRQVSPGPSPVLEPQALQVVEWATTRPVSIRLSSGPVQLSLQGQVTFTIHNLPQLRRGTGLAQVTANRIQPYVRAMVLNALPQRLPDLCQNKGSLTEICAGLPDIATTLQTQLEPAFAALGLTLTHLSLAQMAPTGGGNQNTGEEENRPMNAPIDLNTARHRLETERAVLQARIAEVGQTLDLPDERLTDILDVAEAASDRQLQTTLLAHSQQHLQEVETALRRLEAGTYGLCEHCGRAIQPERLSVLPYTTTCFNCQTRQEQVNV